MHSRDSLNILISSRSIATFLCAPMLLAALLHSGAAAQTVVAPTPPLTPKSAPVALVGVTWQSLSTRQKSSLAPLEKSWNSLSDGQRRKWLTIAESYPGMGVPEQEKMHSRMVEWAGLSPKDREAARLNFAQAKTIAKSDRAANWEAYQALSPEVRAKLADEAKAKPVGAAVAVKPVAPEKLTAVPVTRHTPEQERAAAVMQRPINRSTLLPQLPASAAGTASTAPSAATPVKP